MTNSEWREHIPTGWQEIFDRLVRDLHDLDPSLLIGQAKQKFGELRVYLRSSSREALDLIDAATRASKDTCEECGKPAKLRNLDGFFTTRCDQHGEGQPAAQEPFVRFRVFQGDVESFDGKNE